jgi:hypothetical protein
MLNDILLLLELLQLRNRTTLRRILSILCLPRISIQQRSLAIADHPESRREAVGEQASPHKADPKKKNFSSDFCSFSFRLHHLFLLSFIPNSPFFLLMHGDRILMAADELYFNACIVSWSLQNENFSNIWSTLNYGLRV